MLIENTERRQLADVVAERIERLIVDGVLKVGQTLPSERRLCEKLGISRSALREGLRVLRGRGIIETSQGRGSQVAKLSGEQDASPLMHLFNSQPRTLYDLLEVRALLEGESARLAALRGDLAPTYPSVGSAATPVAPPPELSLLLPEPPRLGGQPGRL